MALLLLIISMEEGTSVVYNTIPLTQALLMLSFTVPIKYESLVISLVPLGLTLSIVALIRSVSQRTPQTVTGFVWGTAVWTGICVFIAQHSSFHLQDSLWIIGVKSAVVFILGYCLSMSRETPVIRVFNEWLESRMSATLRRTLRLGWQLTQRIIFFFVLLSTLTVMFWVIMNYDSMGKVFSLADMQIGSRIMTTLLSLLWLPNFMLWALAWVLGQGFSIGTLGTFTLWTGQSSNLPSIPIFGLLPDKINSTVAIYVLLVLPVIAIFILGVHTLASTRQFNLLSDVENSNGDDTKISLQTIINFLYPAGAFVFATILTIVCANIAFTLSTGGLGTGNLTTIGVEIAGSLGSVGRPVAWGLFAAWLITLLVVSLRAVTLNLWDRFSQKVLSNSSDNESGSKSKASLQLDSKVGLDPSHSSEKIRKPRATRSTQSKISADASSNEQPESSTTMKENQ